MDSLASHDSRLERSLYPSMQRAQMAATDTFGTTRFAESNNKGWNYYNIAMFRSASMVERSICAADGRHSSRWSSREDLLSPQPSYPISSSLGKDALFVALYDFHGVGDEQLSLRKGCFKCSFPLTSCFTSLSAAFFQATRYACSVTIKQANGAKRS